MRGTLAFQQGIKITFRGAIAIQCAVELGGRQPFCVTRFVFFQSDFHNTGHRATLPPRKSVGQFPRLFASDGQLRLYDTTLG